VIPDRPPSNLHDLDDFDLIALGRRSRISPDQRIALAEKSVGPVPANEVDGSAACTRFKEPPDLFLPAQQAIFLAVHDDWHERAFENGVVRIELRQRP